MNSARRFTLSLLLGVLTPFTVVAQGVVLDTKVAFDHVSLDSAYADAKRNFDGDLLLYFYDVAWPWHAVFISRALENEDLARYVNDNFARIAIDVSSLEGGALLKSMRDQLPYSDYPEGDFIVLQRGGVTLPHGQYLYGWEATEDQDDVERRLEQLRSFKERKPRESFRKGKEEGA